MSANLGSHEINSASQPLKGWCTSLIYECKGIKIDLQYGCKLIFLINGSFYIWSNDNYLYLCYHSKFLKNHKK